MTEQEWLECADPYIMLGFLRSIATERRLRLFAVGCCRKIWHRLTDARSRRAVEVAEQFADDPHNQEIRDALGGAASAASAVAVEAEAREDIFRINADAAVFVCHSVDNAVSLEFTKDFAVITASYAAHPENLFNRHLHCKLLRDIFGNPFRPVPAEPSWLTGNVVSLATVIYDERAFERLPILADALEDAGCANGDILDHCRLPGEHVRGCWPVDLVLGKS